MMLYYIYIYIYICNSRVLYNMIILYYSRVLYNVTWYKILAIFYPPLK